MEIKKTDECMKILAICEILAICDFDAYSNRLNFVFGQASVDGRASAIYRRQQKMVTLVSGVWLMLLYVHQRLSRWSNLIQNSIREFRKHINSETGYPLNRFPFLFGGNFPFYSRFIVLEHSAFASQPNLKR